MSEDVLRRAKRARIVWSPEPPKPPKDALPVALVTLHDHDIDDPYAITAELIKAGIPASWIKEIMLTLAETGVMFTHVSARKIESLREDLKAHKIHLMVGVKE